MRPQTVQHIIEGVAIGIMVSLLVIVFFEMLRMVLV